MHVRQLLLELEPAGNREGMITGLPEPRPFRIEATEIGRGMVLIPGEYGETRSPLPSLYEGTELVGFSEPDDGVDMVWHDDEPDTSAALPFQLIVQDAEDHPPRSIEVEEPAASIAREGEEVGKADVVVDASFGHVPIMP